MSTPPTAAPSGKIERLLVWFATNNLVDTAAVGQGLRSRLSERGIAVEVGASRPLELDRADEQRPFVARFKPTHRLDIEVVSAQSGSAGSFVIVRASLYRANDVRPIRIITLSSKGRASTNLVDAVIDKLHGDGLI